MNVFYLHHDPEVAAQYMHDKHVVKMILETAQILSTVCQRHGTWVQGMYKPTHANHPSVRWAGDSARNFYWLVDHGQHLCNEYTYRYGKRHKSVAVIDLCAAEAPVFTALHWTQPPQAMPDEFKIPDDSVAAYRAYYLGRKVQQSRWTRRPVPEFVLKGMPDMAKTKQVRATKAPTPVAADAPATASTVGVRGPKGVALDSRITLLAESNPKRPGSKAHSCFSHYRDGMSVQEYLDAVGTAATPNLVYDAAHGFIAIEGYSPKLVTRKERAPKVEKPAKPAKAPRAKKAKQAAPEVDVPEVEDEVVAETID